MSCESERKVGYLARDAAGVGLRALREDDAEGVFAGWSDAAVIRSLRDGDDIPWSLEEARAYIFFSRGMGETGRNLAIDVDGQFAGCFSWKGGLGVWMGSAEISYWLLPNMRGKGVAHRAVKLALCHLFEKRNQRRVSALVAADNLASQHVLQTAGMRREARLREALLIEQQPVDALYYGLLAHEYSGQNERRETP